MPKVLLVDDERTSSNLLTLSLELDGFKVVACHSLDEARKQLDADFKAVILDYHLPLGESGLTLLREIRQGQTRLSHQMPVIITSGDDRCLPLAEAEKASLVLIKPFSPSLLSEMLYRLMAAENPPT